MLNLILGILWLAGAIALFAYETATGRPLIRSLFGGISSAWILLLLAAWNFVRYYSSRMGRAEQESLRIAHEERLRRARFHERPSVPDPTFDFSDKPAAPPRNLTDQPPSSN
jgi:hypothetical protein